MSVYKIVDARPQDLGVLPAIEIAAATLLYGHAPSSVLDATTSEQEFKDAQAEGRLWIALADDVPVGFAQVELLGLQHAHLKEIDVHPDHGRRGLGKRLVTAVCEWAVRSGHQDITLTTFRDVPFNMPFYARLGFEEVATNELSAELIPIVADETRRGLDLHRRVVMRRRLPSAHFSEITHGTR